MLRGPDARANGGDRSMFRDKRVVVVMPAYNAAETLETTHREVLDQGIVDVLKDNLRGTILLNSDSVENRMTAIAKNEMFFGRYLPMKEVTKAIEKVTAGDLLRVARKIIRPQQMILSVMGPQRNGAALRSRVLRQFES